MTWTYHTPPDAWLSLPVPVPVPVDDDGEDDPADELKKRIPEDCRIVGYWEPEALIEYVPTEDLYVDGIRYGVPSNHMRPMFSIEEQCTRAAFAVVTPSRPPTDEEVDWWIRTGDPIPRKGWT